MKNPRVVGENPRQPLLPYEESDQPRYPVAGHLVLRLKRVIFMYRYRKFLGGSAPQPRNRMAMWPDEVVSENTGGVKSNSPD